MNTLLRVINLSVVFTEREKAFAVRDVNLSLHSGETLALVGESGCGKSITAKQIMRLLPYNATTEVNGEIFYQDVDLCKLPESKLCKIRGNEIAIIFQDSLSALNPIMTVGTQICEAIRAHISMSKKEAARKTLKLLEEVCIPNPAKVFSCYPHELSGGQRQRVMIAMALSCNPKILIADEPTTALDVATQSHILDLLENQKKSGLSTLFITHDLGIVSKIADRVAVVYAGIVVETGTKTQIFDSPMHPYTQLLVSLTQISNRHRKDILPTICGSFPSVNEKIHRCPFAECCEYTMPKCYDSIPSCYKMPDGHSVSCSLYEI